MGVFFSIFEASFPDGHLLLKFFRTVTLRVCWVHLDFSWFWFKATCLSPSWRSLNFWRGHLNISKKSRWITWQMTFSSNNFCFDTNDEKLSLIHQSNGLRGFVLRHGLFGLGSPGGGEMSRHIPPRIQRMDTKKSWPYLNLEISKRIHKQIPRPFWFLGIYSWNFRWKWYIYPNIGE